MRLPAIVGALIFCAALLAAQTDAPKPTASKSKGGTATGCLAKGDTTGQYTLTMKGGRKLAVTGTADMEKHAGHTVTLTGTRKGQSFEATNLKHVSATCDIDQPGAAKTKK